MNPVADAADLLDALKPFRPRIRFDELLARYTSMYVGGRARFLAAPRDVAQLREMLRIFHTHGVPVRALGGGSNLLIRDEPIEDAVIRFHDLRQLHIEEPRVTVGAGFPLSSLISRVSELGLAGMETLVGIPGTVGGAVCMNAGGKYGSIGPIVESVLVFHPDGSSEVRGRDRLEFAYRKSNLGDGFIAEVVLTLSAGDPDALLARAREILREKKATQPLTSKSVGCIFKNPPGNSAGRLIEQSGLKGVRVGDAVISTMHGNFFVNSGHATAADMLALIEKARAVVKERTGVDLELEVRMW